MKFIARFFSVVLHPFLLPITVFSFIFYALPSLVSPIKPEAFGSLLLLIAITTCILPCFLVFVLYKLKVVSTANIEGRRDRFIPQILASLIYAVTTWLFYQRLSIAPIFYVLVGSMTLCMIAVTVINFLWKISAHSTGVGGLVSLLFYFAYHFADQQLLALAFVGVLCAGIVMSARLYLQVHTLSQVCMGFLLGLNISIFCLSHIS